MKQNNIRGVLAEHSLIPVVKFSTGEEIEPLLAKLRERRVSCIEITLRTGFALEAIEQVKKKHGDWLTVGAGTVVDETQVSRLAELEVDFIVCPGTKDQLIDPLKESGRPFITGVATPGEIMNAMSHDLNTFKFFPANLFGGIEAIKAYGQLFPSLRFCPTGGIGEESFREYLALENVISVGGSWMIK